MAARRSGSSSSSGFSAKCQLFWTIDSVGVNETLLSRHIRMNSAEGSGASTGAPLPGPKVSTVECRKSPRPASTNCRPSASSSMWATGTSPLAMASSTMAVRISGVILRPGSGISLTHILTKWTPWPARARTISRASSSEVGCWAPALKPPGCVNPRPAVNMRGVSGRPALASSINSTCSALSVPMLRAVVTP